MKTFYNVINAILCCAKEARASIVLDIKWVQFVLQNCEKLQNYWFNLNRVKKEKILFEVCMIKKQRLIVLLTSDVKKKEYLKDWFTRHQICRQDLLVK